MEVNFVITDPEGWINLTSYRFCQLLRRNILHLTDSARRLEVHHVAFVTQPTF